MKFLLKETTRTELPAYHSEDGRFTLLWADRHGASKVWLVVDSKTSRSRRVDTLEQAQDVAEEMAKEGS